MRNPARVRICPFRLVNPMKIARANPGRYFSSRVSLRKGVFREEEKAGRAGDKILLPRARSCRRRSANRGFFF